MKHRQIFPQLALFGTTIVVLSGFGSCSVSLNEVCTQRLPAFDDEVVHRIASLKSAHDSQGRALASADGSFDLSKEDQEKWQEWAENILKDTQRYIDVAEADPTKSEAKAELSNIANDFVAFHGYARQGLVSKMITVLERIRGRTQRTRRLACESR